MLRAMMLEFPNDPACDYLDLQYMFGDSLLVAPVFSHDGIVNYYVPAGKWTSLLNGTVIEGPRWIREVHDFLSLPLLVRPNSVIPIGNQSDKPDYEYSDGVTLQIYQLEQGKQALVEIPALDGRIQTRFNVRREDNTIHVQRQGSSSPWNVLLVGIDSVENLDNAEIEIMHGSTFIRVKNEINDLELKMEESTADEHR